MKISWSPHTSQRRKKGVRLSPIPEERHVRFLIPARDIYGGVLPPRRVFPSIPFVSRKCQLMLVACPGTRNTDRVTTDVAKAAWRQHQYRHIHRGSRLDNPQNVMGRSSLVVVKIPNKTSIFVSKAKRTTRAFFHMTGLAPQSLARLARKPRPHRQDPRREARGRLLGLDAVKYTRSPSPFPRCESCPHRAPSKSTDKAPQRPSMKLTKQPTKSFNKRSPGSPSRSTVGNREVGSGRRAEAKR